MDTLPPHEPNDNSPKKRKPISEATKRKISQTLSGRKLSEERIQKSRLAQEQFKLRPDYDEYRAKQSEIVKRSYDAKLRQSRSETGKKSWSDGREQRLEALNTPEVKAKMSASMKARWEKLSLEERNEILAPRRAKALADRHSKLEMKVASALDGLGIEYIEQYVIGGCCVDFYIPAKNLVIEVNGCYWHGCEQCGWNEPSHLEKRKSDRKRNYALIGCKYKLHVIWEHEIKGRGPVTKGYLQRLFTSEFYDAKQR